MFYLTFANECNKCNLHRASQHLKGSERSLFQISLPRERLRRCWPPTIASNSVSAVLPWQEEFHCLSKQAGTAIAMPSFCCCQVLLDGFRASADERFWANQLVNSEELGFSSAGSFWFLAGLPMGPTTYGTVSLQLVSTILVGCSIYCLLFVCEVCSCVC